MIKHASQQPFSMVLYGLVGFALFSGSAMAVTSSPTSAVKGRAPVMAAVTISHADVNANGAVDTGDTLTAVDGAITDADLDVPIASTYRWNNGAVDLGTGSSYAVLASDLGSTITLFAKPRTDSAITDPAEGAEASVVQAVAASGTVLSVTIAGDVNGSPQVATPLTSTVTCLGSCGTLSYKWQLETAIGSDAYADISAATSSTYTPVRGDQRRKIRLVVN